MALIDLPTYKSIMGLQTGDDRDDDRISALLPAVSRAVATYTGRDFTLTDGSSSTRAFQYDGSGFLDIDDCTSVISLTTDSGVPGQLYALDYNAWTVMPQSGSDVFYYLLINGGPFNGISPQMGFTYNLDTIGVSARMPIVNVTAQWGWAAIPADVALAAALTLSELLSTDSGDSDGLTGEAIEGYSRQWGGKSSSAVTALAIPNRARDLLASYQRIFI